MCPKLVSIVTVSLVFFSAAAGILHSMSSMYGEGDAGFVSAQLRPEGDTGF